jgi:hypothetical protein
VVQRWGQCEAPFLSDSRDVSNGITWVQFYGTIYAYEWKMSISATKILKTTELLEVSVFYFFFAGIFIRLIPGFLAGRSTLYGIVWYDGMKDPYGKDFDFSCKYADSTKGKQSTINFFWWIESTINHLEFPMLMLH